MVFDKASHFMSVFYSKMDLDIISKFESTSEFYSKIPGDLTFESASAKNHSRDRNLIRLRLI